MSNDSKKTSAEDDTLVWIVGGLMAAIAIALAIPFAVGGFLFYIFRDKLSRTLWLASGTFFTLVSVLTWEEMWGNYKSWMGGLLSGNVWNSQAFLSMVVWGFVIASVIAVVDGTARGHGVIGVIIKKVFKKEPSLLDKTTVLPTDEQFQKLSEGDFSRLSAGTEAFAEGKDYFVMGVDSTGAEVRITERDIGMHMLAFGGTGSGKTVSLQVIAGGLLDLGWEGLILDLKEDTGLGGLRDWCDTYASAHGLPYQELALSNTNTDYTFDPLYGLNADEARDTILALSRFDDEYYKNVSIKVLGQTLKLLYWAHEAAPQVFDRPNLSMVAQYMSEPDLAKALRPVLNAVVGYDRPVKDSSGKTIGKEHVTGLLEPQVTLDDFDILRANQTDKTYQQQANSWGAKIGNLYETQAGRDILRPNPNLSDMDVTRGGLTYIGLDSTSKLDLSKVISASVLQRIAAAAAQRVRRRDESGPVKRKFIIIDEASIVDRTIVHALLSKARSAGVSIILATQGPRDWMDRDGDDFAKLSQNTNVALIMSQGEPESAKICADYIGKHEVIQANLRYSEGALDDAGSVRETYDYIVQPDDLRGLGVGEGVVRIGKPETRVSFVKVIPRAAEKGGQRPAPSQRSSAPSPRAEANEEIGGSNPFGVNLPTGIPRPPRSN